MVATGKVTEAIAKGDPRHKMVVIAPVNLFRKIIIVSLLRLRPPDHPGRANHQLLVLFTALLDDPGGRRCGVIVEVGVTCRGHGSQPGDCGPLARCGPVPIDLQLVIPFEVGELLAE